MNKTLSLYLDVLRVLAAFTVVIGHAHGYILPAMPKIIGSHAEEAVVVFFVLSGFVIMFVLSQKETGWRSYLIARALRIYSVVPVALLVTFLVDSLGKRLNPQAYATDPVYSEVTGSSLFRALTFTNEIWHSHVVFGSNEAYWSLGFEVPYYVIFGFMFFLGWKYTSIVLVAAFFIFGPKVIFFFPLWLLGVWTYRIVCRPMEKLTRAHCFALIILSLAVMFGVRLMSDYLKYPIYKTTDLITLVKSGIYFYSIAICVAINIIAVARLSQLFVVKTDFIAPAIRWVAGGTFTLYLVHQPLLMFAASTIPGLHVSPALGVACLLLIVAVCYAVAELGERRKAEYQDICARFWGRYVTGQLKEQ